MNPAEGMNMRLIAEKPFRYRSRMLAAGDMFVARDRQMARALELFGMARRVKDRTPDVVPPPPENMSAGEIDVLRDRARSAGIAVDNRWGRARLEREISDATAES